MNGMFSLEGKTALITGAGRGIGQAIAIAFAEAGADVALASRTQAELEETADQVRALDRQAAVFPVDLSESGSAESLVEAAVRELGRLDVLVTSSGRIIRKAALDIDESDWDPVIDLNLKARFFVSQAAARHMQASGGSIIHIGSLSNFLGIPNIIAYTASNGGLASMMRAQAIEWAAQSIRVNVIAPGTIVTRQTEGLLQNPEMLASRLGIIPMNRLGDPEDVAGAALFLATRASAYVTGHVLVVDGGWLASGNLKG